MFRAAARPTGASAHYGQIDLTARIASASPHGLVVILYEELLRAITMMRKSSQPHRRSESLARAISILQALHDSLDFDSGGEIASNLASIYAEARRQLLAGVRDANPDALQNAETMISEIAKSWDAIAERS